MDNSAIVDNWADQEAAAATPLFEDPDELDEPEPLEDELDVEEFEELDESPAEPEPDEEPLEEFDPPVTEPERLSVR